MNKAESVVSRFAAKDKRLLARCQLSLSRPDLSLRQSPAEGTAKIIPREASGGWTLGHNAGPELYLCTLKPGDQEV